MKIDKENAVFSFGIGLLSLAGIIVFPILYIVGRLVRAGGAWLEGEDGPKDRAKAKIILFAVIGFLIGCFAQPKWDQISDCHDATGNWGKCALSIKGNN
ncbi:hypothetical protein AI29_13175 [bacteria symbiont BFo2 of Frankliniella occidentalis]|nr:hypothetical protein AI29_13175 [bacteria symbiont BFo2 of Frankliniella occidentalis]KYP90975.1 hypothetical protein WB60_07225 [bacteria symbiont BFo2 of Frankliniella occidentalis]KYP95986.1 hypothetical protein WB67_03990 [bacteria symbiont BFo2 of Frankliniella occidentalis]